MAITNTGAKAGALAAGGFGRTAGGGQNVSQALEKEAREKEKAAVVPTAERDLSRLGAGETALGPNPQEPAPRQIPRRRNQRRRHRPLLPAETVDQRQELLLPGKASLTRGGATTARRRSPPTH